MAVHSGAPVRHVQVVTKTFLATITFHLALGGHEEVGAVILNGGLGRVDEGKTVGNSVSAQAVLLSQDTGGLLNDHGQGADLFIGEFPFDSLQTLLVFSLVESGADGVIGDASGLGVVWGSGSAKCV